jgi:hypothetical protein
MGADIETLHTIAEIAATFAGFAALVSTLGRRLTHGGALHDLLRLRLVIAVSIVVVASALLPIPLIDFELEAGWSWRIAAAVFLLLIYTTIVSFINSYRPVRGTFPPDRLAVSVALILGIGVQIALAMIIFDLAPERDAALYVAALVATLCQAAFVFMRLVESTFGHIAVKR